MRHRDIRKLRYTLYRTYPVYIQLLRCPSSRFTRGRYLFITPSRAFSAVIIHIHSSASAANCIRTPVPIFMYTYKGYSTMHQRPTHSVSCMCNVPVVLFVCVGFVSFRSYKCPRQSSIVNDAPLHNNMLMVSDGTPKTSI